MAGIIAFSAYVPTHRLKRSDIAGMWGAPTPGEKAVANYDEDSLTMAVAAAVDSLKEVEKGSVEGLFFASTTFPYVEKQSACVINSALALNKENLTIDFANSIRGGTGALKAAADMVESGSRNNILVCAADTRLGLPGSRGEMLFGDGAVAAVIGKSEQSLITIDGHYTLAEEIVDTWRTDNDRFVSVWDERFASAEIYQSVVPDAVGKALAKFGLKPEDFAKVIFNAPDGRQLKEVAKKTGFQPDQVQEPLDSAVGNTGAAQSLMMLFAGVDKAGAGDRLLVVNYGDGCDIFAFTVNVDMSDYKNCKRFIANLDNKTPASYSQYLRWRDLIKLDPPKRPLSEQPSAAALWRDRDRGLPLHGGKCLACGTPQYPRHRICVKCGAKDQFEDYAFADKIGTISSYSHDNLAISVEPPITIASIDFPGGGRIISDMTDRVVDEVSNGMQVEMTFRRVRLVNGISDYWWKCRPVR